MWIIIFLLSGGIGNTNHIPGCLIHIHKFELSLDICLFNFRKFRYFCCAAAGGNNWEVTEYLEEFGHLCFDSEPRKVSLPSYSQGRSSHTLWSFKGIAVPVWNFMEVLGKISGQHLAFWLSCHHGGLTVWGIFNGILVQPSGECPFKIPDPACGSARGDFLMGWGEQRAGAAKCVENAQNIPSWILPLETQNFTTKMEKIGVWRRVVHFI